MKKQTEKREIRRLIEQQVLDYVRDGGAVDNIDRGVSAYTDPGSARPTSLFETPSASRTPVNDVVSNLEERRRPANVKKTTRQKRALRVPVYDDFGEVIRWVWQHPD